MEENKSSLSEAEKSGIAKKKAINRAVSYFSDDDSLFEFEGFEIEDIAKDVDELTKKEEQLAEESRSAENAGVSDSGAESSDQGDTTEISEQITDSEESDSSQADSSEEQESSESDDGETDNGEADRGESDVTDDSDETFSEYSESEDTQSEADEDDYEENEFDYVSDRQNTDHADKKYSDQLPEYSYQGEKLSAEGQLRFEEAEYGVESSDITEDKTDNDKSGKGDDAGKNELMLSEDVSDDLYDEADLDNEVWDRAGKEEWEARESFLTYCKTLTLPQVRSGNYGSAEPEPAKAKITSSGYRYAESERMPVFSDGFNGGDEKAGYAERERHYCERRKTKREVFLRENTRALHRSVLYTALILFTVLLLEVLNIAFKGQEIMLASIEIGLILLGCVFTWKGLVDGVKCAAKGTFIPEVFSSLTVILSLVYAVVTVSVPGDNAVLIGLPGASAIFLIALYRSLMAKREKKVFDITADYGDYCTEVKLASFKGSPEEVAFGGYASESSSLYKTNRIQRPDAGYNGLPIRDECFGLVKVLLICIVCAAIAVGIAFGFIKRDPLFGFFSSYLLVSLGSPLCSLISLSLPRYIISEDVALDGAAIADFDDESDELDENVIMLREQELFPPEKIRIVDAYWNNSHFLEAHISKAAAAFKKTGGLLSGLFAGIDVGTLVYREPVITDIADNGITVKVDDSLVRAGTDEYLEKHGIEIERYHDVEQKDTRVLYIANNGEFFSRVVIQFVPDERLCRKMAELRQADTLFSLKTCNPCIDSSLVFYTTGLEPELLRVVKYLVEDDVCEPDTDREGFLVSRTGAFGLFSALLGYKKQKKLVVLGSRVAAVSGLLGVLLSLAVALSGVKWAFISFAVLGFHLVTSAVASAIGLSGKVRRTKKK